jgi:hypothetical protein
MQLVEPHEAADAAIMKSSRKLFGASPLKSAASEKLLTPLEGQSDTLANTHA